MTQPACKVAILHDDLDVVAHVTALATGAGIEVVCPESLPALQSLGADPLLSAVVIDLSGRRSGGFEAVEQLSALPSHATVIVVTGLDAKTIDSAQRLAQSKGLKLIVHRKDTIDDTVLLAQLCAARKQAPGFGPEALKECIEKRYVRVEYQPKVPLLKQTETDYGVEALCRMFHPHFGAVPPDQFIPLAEKHGLVLKLTDAVVCQSLEDHRAWRQQGLSLRLAINISPELLKDSKWCDLFLQRCAEYQVEAEQITLEITESSSAATHPSAIDMLTRLRLKGFALSIDDFGTGFSSLSALYKLPFSELKIDKSFIQDLQKSAEARALIESTVSMAQRIGIKVVAEGVESEAIFRELRLIGCHEAQGYFISRPMPADKVPQFVADWNAVMRSQAIHAGMPNALPKIAMIQVLLNDILSDKSVDVDSTLVLEHFDKARNEGEEDKTLTLARSIPPLVLQGKTIEALANCHAAARLFEADDSRPSLKNRIAQLQSLLEQELVITADVDLAGGHGLARLLPRTSATLGRPSSSATVDIPVTCRWFSRGEKNLRIFMKSGEWFVEDRGSTNGNFIGKDRLEPRRPYPLPVGETVVETGNQLGSAAPVSIRLRRPALNPGAVVVTFAFDAVAVREGLDDEQARSLEEDLTTTWIIFDGQIGLGKSKDCALRLKGCKADIAANIRFKNGYWVCPMPDTPLTVNEAKFSREVPLSPKAELTLAGAKLSVREATKDDNATAAPQPAADPVALRA